MNPDLRYPDSGTRHPQNVPLFVPLGHMYAHAIQRFTIRVLPDGKMAHIEIEDNGPGMDEEIYISIQRR
jgi:hypothetical protein